MKELSIFVDESGSDNLRDRYYLITLVLHEQADSLADGIKRYEQSLKDKKLPDIPFHMTPLLYHKKGYENLDEATRKKLLSTFRVFFRRLPIRYACLEFKMKELEDAEAAAVSMRRGLVNLIFDNLAYFQGFDNVKIYYGSSAIQTRRRRVCSEKSA